MSNNPLTFKERVKEFWRWFDNFQPKILEAIQSKNGTAIAEDVHSAVHTMLPGAAWVFGPGPNGSGHSLTLSGEGNLHLQFLTEYWRTQTPEFVAWTFYSSRQPSNHLDGWQLQIGGEQFKPLEFWLVPTVDKETEKVDIAVWHPLFPNLPERERWKLLFIVLDEILGEFGTQMWIGQISMNDEKLADAIPLKELSDLINRLKKENQWEKAAPTESWLTYQGNEINDEKRRGDIIVGSTRNVDLLEEFLSSEDHLENPLKGTGADYIYLQFSNASLPKGGEAAARGRIEDVLQETLARENSGIHLGGAMGTKFAYIDFLIFDGDKSKTLINDALSTNLQVRDLSIQPFAKNS